MKRMLILLGMTMLCLAFIGCGRNQGQADDMAVQDIEQSEGVEDNQEIAADTEIPHPAFWEVPVDSGNIPITVDGRTVTFSLATSADVTELSIIVLEDGENPRLIYIEQVPYESPLSHTFVLGDDVQPGTYALIIGGEGSAFPIRSNFELR